MLRVLFTQLILLCIFRFCNSSNYSIFYHRNPSRQYFAAINVTSNQFGTLDRMSFDVQYLPGQSAIVMLNNKRCQTTCDVFLFDGESAVLTFNSDKENIISFYQYYKTITDLFYQSCYQPMQFVSCRFRQSDAFEICICNNHLAECIYDQPLYFDESWCNSSTSLPSTSMATTTTKKLSPPITTEINFSSATTSSTGGSSLKNFTLMYRSFNGSMSSNVLIRVNISITLKTPGTVEATFAVWQIDDLGPFFYVDNQVCYIWCAATISPTMKAVSLTMSGHSCNEILITADKSNQIFIVYDECKQPMDTVKCRRRSFCDEELCLCNGLNADWSPGRPFLLHKDNCSIPSTTPGIFNTTTAMTTKLMTTSLSTTSIHSTSTITTMKTTRSSSTSSTKTHSLTTTTPENDTTQSSSKPSTTTYSLTTTTPVNDTLKHLSESGVGPNNVTRILNETLVFSETRSNLTSTQIQQITTILNNSAAINGLQPSDSKNILLNMDCILSADSQQIQASGNSSQILLSMLPTLVTNTNASQFDFLTGENLGFTARNINCSSATDDGLIDYGNIFELLNGSIPNGDLHNSIYIPLNDICNQLQASQLFMTVYRNRKLFTGTKRYQSYGSASTIAGRSAEPSAETGLLQETPAQNTDPLPSPCSRQIALPEEAPVMAGTILKDGVAVSRLSTESTVAVLRFNITNVLTPLHGHFRVTWWDTEKLEWSTESQCETSTEGETIVAKCNHLTDFTLIVDAALNDPNVCETALIDLGYVVNSLSIISLSFLMLMSLCAYWPSLRSSRALGILTGYAIPTRDFVSLMHKLSLLLFYAVFTIFSDKKVSGEACEFFGALSYFLLLCSVILTVFQALRLTAVIGRIHSWIHLILAPSSSITFSLRECYTASGVDLATLSAAALSVPIEPLEGCHSGNVVPFAITVLLLVFTNFFDRGDCFCWVRPDYIIYAVIIPISILVLNGIACTILVSIRLFGVKRKLSKSVRFQDRQFFSKVVAVILMQISLGMPWILQYLTLYSPYTTVWHYVFTIVMGSQGTTLALLFLYKRRRSMSSYRRSHQRTQMSSRDETASS